LAADWDDAVKKIQTFLKFQTLTAWQYALVEISATKDMRQEN